MKLYLVETSDDQWLVRAKSEVSAIAQIDPQGYIAKQYNIKVIEIVQKGIEAIIRHW